MNTCFGALIPVPSHGPTRTHKRAEISRDTSFTDNGVGYVCKQIYRYVDVAAYFRAFVILGDARGSVDASASAPEEALELGGAGATDVGAFKMSDGPDSCDFAERSGDADGRRFCGVDLISAFTLGRATPKPPLDISPSSLENHSSKSASLGVLWASMEVFVFRTNDVGLEIENEVDANYHNTYLICPSPTQLC